MGSSAFRACPLLALVVLAACGDDDATGDGGPLDAQADGSDGGSPAPALAEVVTGLADAPLGVWAGEGYVYAVGADNGSGPIVMRRQGDGAFERVETGVRGNLWWMTQAASDTILIAGEGGLILEHQLGSDSFRTLETPDTRTYFGIWAAATGETWAVGADVEAEENRGRVLVRDGDGFRVDERVPADAISGATLFKVWGRSASDVWVVGEYGTSLHFDGDTWTPVSTDVSSRLLTVHGTATVGPIAVGGAGNGVIIEWDGDAFVDTSPPLVPAFNGIFLEDSGDGWAVGLQGLIARRAAGQWSVLDDTGTFADLHSVAIDAEGRPWAVGGSLTSRPLDKGVIVGLASEAP